MEFVMPTTKKIHYGTIEIRVNDRDQNITSLSCKMLDKLRDLYFLADHKIPLNNLDFGYQLIRTTANTGLLAHKLSVKDPFEFSESKEAVAFFTASITTKSSVSSYVPSKQLIHDSRFDPYMSVAWIREFAHDPWENPKLCVDWLVHKVRAYGGSVPTSLSPREIIWRVYEGYSELQMPMLRAGFIAESYNHRTKDISFSMILS